MVLRSQRGQRAQRKPRTVAGFPCGADIAATVDVKALAGYAALLPNVVLSRDYKYMCSDPGQDLIRQDIRDHQLNRIVAASCSPHRFGVGTHHLAAVIARHFPAVPMANRFLADAVETDIRVKHLEGTPDAVPLPPAILG